MRRAVEIGSHLTADRLNIPQNGLARPFASNSIAQVRPSQGA